MGISGLGEEAVFKKLNKIDQKTLENKQSNQNNNQFEQFLIRLWLPDYDKKKTLII